MVGGKRGMYKVYHAAGTSVQRCCMHRCQKNKIDIMMGKLLRSVYFLLFLAACEKTNTTPDPVLADLIFVKTTTGIIQPQQGTIVSQAKAYGPDLCYKFSKFDIKETAAREFEIRAKATNAGDKPGTACAQAIYYVDTTCKINAAVKGKYLLHFYNKDQLFKTDTVQVN